MVWIVFPRKLLYCLISLDRLSWQLDDSPAAGFVHTRGFIIIDGELERNIDNGL
jgi:hypothetical protein